MDKDEPFFHSEVDEETPKQSPQSSQTWSMDKIRQSRFQQKMSSLLSPVTPKRNYSISNAKSLLLQCLRDSKSDPLPRRRFPASYSDEGILMDGVLVTSASGKKLSDSPSSLSSLGRSARSSVVRSQHKNTEFSSPRRQTGRNQDTTRSQISSGGKGKMLANSPSTKAETPKAANPSKLQASAEPFILPPRSTLQQLPFDSGPHFQGGKPSQQQQLPPSYGHPYLPPSYTYPRSLQGPPLAYLQLPASPHGPHLYQTHHPLRSPRPTGYQIRHEFNQSPARISLPTTPFSSQPNTNTRKPPVHTPISAANLSTSTTTNGSRLGLPPSSVDGLDVVSSHSDELERKEKKTDLVPSDELGTMTQKPDLSSPSATTKKDWSPSDNGLPTFTQAQADFLKSQDRVLPDDVFEHYKYRKRLPIFTQLCLDDQRRV